MKWREALRELERALSKYSETLEVLRQIDSELAKHAFELDRVLGLVAHGAQRLTGATVCGILVPISTEALRIEWSTEPSLVMTSVPIERSFTGAVYTRRQALLEDDVASGRTLYFSLSPSTVSELAVPMSDEYGAIVAVINLESNEPHFFTEEHKEIVTLLAGQGAIAIRNATIHKQFLAILELVNRLDPASSSLRPVLSLIGQRAKELTQAEHCQVLVPFNGELIVEFTTGQEEPGATRVKVQESVTGRAYLSRESLLIGDLANDEAARDLYKSFLGTAIRSELVVPIQRTDEVLALINLESPRVNAFHDYHRRLIELLADQAALAIASVKRFQESLWLSQTQADLWALAQIGDVYGPLIHRLNSDAGAINGLVGEIRSKYPPQDAVEESLLGDIQKKAREILKVPVRMRRSLERIQKYHRIDINEVIDRVLASVSANTAAVVRNSLDREIPQILISEQVEDALEILVNNAIEATRGTGDIEISTQPWISRTTDGRKIEHGVEFSIGDNCGGIAPEIAERIWDLSFTTKQTKTKAGLGFGLWWARSFVERMGGTIALQPKRHLADGQLGCRFVVRLPTEARRMPVAKVTHEREVSEHD